MISGIGTLQLVFFLVIALLLFGKRLPGAMRSLGQGIHEFRGAMQNENRHGVENQDT